MDPRQFYPAVSSMGVRILQILIKGGGGSYLKKLVLVYNY